MTNLGALEYMEDCALSTAVSYKPLYNSRYTIYPNPGDGRIFLKAKNGNQERLSIRVLNMQGNVLMEKQSIPINRVMELDFHALNPGIYYILIQNENSNEIHKYVVQ